MTQSHAQTINKLIDGMEEGIRELVNSITPQPKISTDGPVGTTLDVITNLEMNTTQRMIMLYLIFMGTSKENIIQKEIYKALGLSNKCVRENLTALHEAGYVKKGSKYSTWVV